MPRTKKIKKTEESLETPGLIEASEDKEQKTETAPEETSVVEETATVAKVEEPVVEELPVTTQGEDDFAKLTNTLNSEFKKVGNGLTAQVAKVGQNVTYVLIKAASSAYCFARIGAGREGSRAKMDLEFLSNVPADAHRQILAIAKTLNISDSKRLFFHPSGIL